MKIELKRWSIEFDMSSNELLGLLIIVAVIGFAIILSNTPRIQ